MKIKDPEAKTNVGGPRDSAQGFWAHSLGAPVGARGLISVPSPTLTAASAPQLTGPCEALPPCVLCTLKWALWGESGPAQVDKISQGWCGHGGFSS